MTPPTEILIMRQEEIIEELLKCSSQIENTNLSEENEDKVNLFGGSVTSSLKISLPH